MIYAFNELDSASIYRNLSFTEMLFSIKIAIAEKAFIDNYLKQNGYKYEDVESFLYKMSFFEKEDLSLVKNRTLYLYLNKLKESNFDETELCHCVDWVCDFFKYPQETKGLIYYMPPDPNRLGQENVEKWTIYGALSRYLERYKSCMDTTSADINPYNQLFEDKFALVKNGEYKSCFITGGIKESVNMKYLHIWSDNMLVNPVKFEICFKKDKDIRKFMTDKEISLFPSVDYNYFLDEDAYISNFKKEFNLTFEKIVS
jgi:hypothetical protein